MSQFTFVVVLLVFVLIITGLVFTLQKFRHQAKMSGDTLLILLITFSLLFLALIVLGLLS